MPFYLKTIIESYDKQTLTFDTIILKKRHQLMGVVVIYQIRNTIRKVNWFILMTGTTSGNSKVYRTWPVSERKIIGTKD